ncbi:MAG: hypothetical protein JNL72_07115 [Flavipsychrobacter sp.]|nr:hypothetical protein [Flavipsychrobacter sp.]
MKRILLVALMAVAAASCTKDKDPEPTPPSTTNDAAGNWTIKVYDGLTLASPAAGTLTMAGTSATAGTANIDVTFDGTNHNTEEDTYALTNSNANIAFTKTSTGSFSVLSGGGTWVINTLNATTLKMTSTNGLVIECTK